MIFCLFTIIKENDGKLAFAANGKSSDYSRIDNMIVDSISCV